jgi:hypothetical protein
MSPPHVAVLEDNCTVDKDSDLLPRILGPLSMAALAIAVTVGGAYALPPSPAEPALPAAPAPAVAARPTQSATAPAAPINQIWECTTNGQRTFSDKPCGDKPSLRELNPINVMDPTPTLPPTRAYQPQAYQPQIDYPPEYSYPVAQESAETSYPVLVAFPYNARLNARRHPDRAHRPYKHAHGPEARRN